MGLKDGAFNWDYSGGAPAIYPTSGGFVTPPTTTNPTPFSGITGTGPSTFTQPTPFSQAGAGTAASLGSAPANEATLRQWLTAQGITGDGQQYWIDSINSKPDGLQAGNAQYWMDKIKGGQAQNAAGGSLSGAFLQPYGQTFSAPTGTDDPGFQFAVQQGQDAIQRSAAAKGTLLTGGTLKDLAKYTAGAALQDYAGAYDRAQRTFGTNYDVFRNNQTDPFNKLFAVSGMGYNAANAQSGALNNYGNNSANTTIGLGNAESASTIGANSGTANAIGSLANWFIQRPRSGVTGQPIANRALNGG